MNFHKRYGWLCMLLFVFAHLCVSSITPFVAAQSTSNRIPTRDGLKEPVALDDVLHEEKSVLYKGYEMAINSQGYPVLKRNGKVLMTFKSSRKDGPYDSVRIGLFSVLGKNDKQIVYQIVNGNICCDEYWIIDVSATRPRVIYSSVDYDLNDALLLYDLNKDGMWEVTQLVYTFRYFYGLCGGCSPHPQVVLRYNRRAGKYLPTKGVFLPDTLKEIKEAKQHVAKGIWDLKDVLTVVLDYIYAGEEARGWAFYNRVYRLRDKEKLRTQIKQELAGDKMYKRLYGR